MNFALEAVKEYRPDIAKFAASINKGAYERNVASSSFNAKPVEQAVGEDVKENDIVVGTIEQASTALEEATAVKVQQFARQFSTPNLAMDLFVKKEQSDKQSTVDALRDRLIQKAAERKYSIV